MFEGFDRPADFATFVDLSDASDQEIMAFALWTAAVADFARNLALQRAKMHEYTATNERADAAAIRDHLPEVKVGKTK